MIDREGPQMDARVRAIPDGERDEVAGLAAVSWMEGGRTRRVGDSAKGLLKFRAEQKATSVIDALNVRRNNVSMETETGSFEAIFETYCS